MNTEQDTQAIEAEIDALLASLTAESAAATQIETQLHTLDEGVDALESHLNASGRDIAEFMEQQGQELDTLIQEEQKEAAAEDAEPEEE